MSIDRGAIQEVCQVLEVFGFIACICMIILTVQCKRMKKGLVPVNWEAWDLIRPCTTWKEHIMLFIDQLEYSWWSITKSKKLQRSYAQLQTHIMEGWNHRLIRWHGISVALTVVLLILPISLETQAMSRMNFWWLFWFMMPYVIINAVVIARKKYL